MLYFSMKFEKNNIPIIAEKLSKNHTSYAKKYGFTSSMSTKAIAIALQIFTSLPRNSASRDNHHMIVALNTELSNPQIIAYHTIVTSITAFLA